MAKDDSTLTIGLVGVFMMAVLAIFGMVILISNGPALP